MMWNRRTGTGEKDEQWQKAFQAPERIPDESKQLLLAGIHGRINKRAGYGRRLLYLGVSAAAAILVTFVARAVFMQQQLLNEQEWKVMASAENKKQVALPDGSVIWLAPHSLVRVYPAFGEKRLVKLDKGAAFFDVTSDKDHPFAVKVNSQQVKVLGTSFTLTRKDTADVSLAVKGGCVALHNSRQQLIVRAGQQVNTHGSIPVGVTTMPVIPADWWVQQEYRLLDVSLNELLNNIESYYHIQLHAQGINRDIRVTLTWNFCQPLENNLAVLNQLTGNQIH